MTYRIKKWGKIGVITLAPILSLSLLGQPAHADTSESKTQQESVHNVANPENVKFSKEKAIERVRELFPILEQAEVQSVQLGQTNQYPLPSNQMVWDIDWSYSVENGSHGFSSEVDAVTGDILNVYLPSILQENHSAYYPPKVSRDEAEKKAKQFINKAASNQNYDDLVTDQGPISIDDALFGPISYRFRFSPEVNGVPSPNESYHVEITGNGEVESFHAPTDSIEYPSAEAVLSLSKATKQFKENLNLQLTYITNRTNEEESTIFLGWKPMDEQSTSQIDAQSGDFLLGNGVTLKESHATFKEISQGKTTFQPIELENGETITADQAANVVSSNVSIPEEKQLQRTSLREDGYFSYKNPVWFLTWSEPGAFGFENQIRAYVDAKTGQLIEVNTRSPRPGTDPIEIDEEEKLSEEELTELALSKIQELYPNASESLKWKINEERYMNAPDENVISFQFQRYINGLPVQNDVVNMTIKRDGELIQYNVRETPDVEEKIQGLKANLSKVEATSTYLNQLESELQYNLIRKGISEEGVEQTEMKLVYKRSLTDVPHQHVVLDAETGKWRSLYTSNGEEEQSYIQPINLEKHWAKDELITLSKHNILQVNKNGVLNPNETLTYGKWLHMMAKAINPNFNRYQQHQSDKEEGISKDHKYYEAVMFAKGKEWFDQEITDLPVDQTLTREQLAQSLVNILQYDKIAGFMNQEPDFSDIEFSEYKGAIHIVNTLGIMQGNHGKFNPDSEVTKAEAAVVMMRMVKLQEKLDQDIGNQRY